MNEVPNPTPTNPTLTDRVVLLNDPAYIRLRRLTYFSLGLSGLLLLLFLIGAIMHHHHMKMEKMAKHGGPGGPGGGCPECHGFGGRGMGMGMERGRWHHHEHGWDRDGGGWGHQEGFRDGGDRFGMMDRDDRGFDHHGFGRDGDDRGGFDRHEGMGGMGMGMDRKGMDQNPPDPAMMTDEILNHLTRQLTLTDDEKAKIKPIVLAQVTDIQKEEQAHRQAFEKQIEDGKAKIRALLTPDQQKELDALPTPGHMANDGAASESPAPATPKSPQ
jgi:hypothetical protein